MLAPVCIASRRHQLVLSTLSGLLLVAVWLHLSGTGGRQWTRYVARPSSSAADGKAQLDSAAMRRAAWLETQCHETDAFEETYGRTNLRMTRAYEGMFTEAKACAQIAGSLQRLRELSRKVIHGHRISISAIGGSGEVD